MFAELGRLKEMCDSYGITLRLVTIPCFPERFYETQRGRDWTMHIGDFDFLAPNDGLHNLRASTESLTLSLAVSCRRRSWT
jgi:hypothetical protein